MRTTASCHATYAMECRMATQRVKVGSLGLSNVWE